MQEVYAEDPRVWNAIFEIVVADLRKCETEGIPLGGDQGRFFPIILNTKGDWSYLDTWFWIIGMYKFNFLVQGFWQFWQYIYRYHDWFIIYLFNLV